MPRRKSLISFFKLLLVLCSNMAFAQAYDSLYLKNGQVVFGELKEISLGKVKFKMDDLTTTDVQMDKVKTLSAGSYLFRIETITKKVFYSRLYSSKRPGYIMVKDSLGGGEIPLEYINTASYYGSNKNIFEGNVSMGYNYTKSSNIGRFNTDLTMRYIMKRVTITNKSSTIITQKNNQWLQDRTSVLFTGIYYVNSTWKAVGMLNYQLNRELGLLFRFQQGAAVGYSLFANTQIRLWTYLGFVVNQERSFEATKADFTAEIPLVLNFDLFRFSKPKVSVSLDNSFYTNLTQKGRIRFDNEIRVTWEAISDFTLNLQFYSNYDSKPLSGTGAAFDYGTVFGIGYKWD